MKFDKENYVVENVCVLGELLIRWGMYSLPVNMILNRFLP